MKTTKLFRYVEIMASITFIFWILETFLFIAIYGWHLKATEKPELICDLIVSILKYITIGMAIGAIWDTFKQVSSFFSGGNVSINIDSDKVRVNGEDLI